MSCHNRLRWAWVAVLLLGIGISIQAAAVEPQVDTKSLVVLSQTVGEKRAVAEPLLDALRELATQAGQYRLLTPPGSSFQKLRESVGCDDDLAVCLGQVGRSLGSQEVLHCTVEQTEEEVMVDLLLVESRRASIRRHQAFAVRGDPATILAGFRAGAARFLDVAPAVPRRQGGR